MQNAFSRCSPFVSSSFAASPAHHRLLTATSSGSTADGGLRRCSRARLPTGLAAADRGRNDRRSTSLSAEDSFKAVLVELPAVSTNSVTQDQLQPDLKPPSFSHSPTVINSTACRGRQGNSTATAAARLPSNCNQHRLGSQSDHASATTAQQLSPSTKDL
jgi:hypothetical protein